MKRILICDDNQARVDDWVNKLKALHLPFEVHGLPKKALHDTIRELERRRVAARTSATGDGNKGTHEFDAADILIIDYDLLHLDESYLTGENVAYLARCYSRCGLIVGMNQFDHGNAFDLSLKGHPESYADVNISAKQL